MNDKTHIGIVGPGLMGSSIATCILSHGHKVTSLIRSANDPGEAEQRISGSPTG